MTTDTSAEQVADSVSSALDILLIDDDELTGERVERLLESDGKGCLSVTTMAQAREASKAVHFSLVIVDRKLNDGDGIDLVREYRAAAPDKPVSLLIFSALDQPKHVADAFAAGADDFISKRCSDSEFLAKVKLLLAKSGRKAAPIPPNEAERLAALHSYAILDTLSEQAFDDVTFLASLILKTPIALISLIDRDRQWFKSKLGIEASQTPREDAFCAHALMQPDDVFVVSDARADARFANNPLVTGNPHIRFYAGAPLLSVDGFAVGTVCVIDNKPREINTDDMRALRALSRLVTVLLEQHKARVALEEVLSSTQSATLKR